MTAKNEVTLEFHQNDDAAVSLYEMRFHVPNDAAAAAEKEGEEKEEKDDAVEVYHPCGKSDEPLQVDRLVHGHCFSACIFYVTRYLIVLHSVG